MPFEQGERVTHTGGADRHHGRNLYGVGLGAWKMKGQKLEIQLPDTPEIPNPLAVHPDIADIRERLARAETQLEQRTTDPAAAEALRLAGEAHQLATAAIAKAEAAAAPIADATDPSRVLEISPPESVPLDVLPTPESLPNPLEPHAPPLPWWHLSRIL